MSALPANDPRIMAWNIERPEMFDAMPPIGHIAAFDSGTAPSASLLPIEAQRFTAIDQINILAEKARLRSITPGAGQALVYQAKREEALRFLTLHPEPNAVDVESHSEWPLLSAELGITGDTLYEVAGTVHRMAQHWIQIAAGIERVRLQAQNDIATAQSDVEIRMVLARLAFPTKQ